MSDFERCPICHKFGFVDSHKCAPAWEAVRADIGYNVEEDFSIVYADDAKSAAENFVAGNFDFESSHQQEIWVRRPGENEWQQFDVSVEAVPEFTATPKNAESSSLRDRSTG